MARESVIEGSRAEDRFIRWLNKHSIPYFQIVSSKNTFSKGLIGIFGAKRPDFLILVQKLGFIVVDVKGYSINRKHNAFSLKYDDIKKYSRLEKSFNIKMWLAFNDRKYDEKGWYWISMSRAKMDGKQIKEYDRKSKHTYYNRYIPLNKLKRVDVDSPPDVFISKLISVSEVD